MDYLEYSRATVLKNVSVYINYTEILKELKDGDVLALSYKTYLNKPSVAQLYFQNAVYIFSMPMYIEMLNAKINSLSATIYHHDGVLEDAIKKKYNVDLKKLSRVEYGEWDRYLSADQVGYAASDVAWIYSLNHA